MTTPLLIIHGPNLNLLGSRENGLYGDLTLDEINARLQAKCETLQLNPTFFQSNDEWEIVAHLQRTSGRYSAVIINPAAFTHTSVAIRDAIAALSIPVVEVHLTNIHARESFRRHSYVSGVVSGTIAGFGYLSYLLAVEAVHEKLKR